MSSYIVEDKTINRIVTFLSWYGHEHKTDMLGSQLNRTIKEFGLSVETEKDCRKFANSLLLLNKLAVDDRYNELNLISLFEFKDEKASIWQVIKSLHCLRYQCSEGDIPKTKLFLFLDRIIRLIEEHLIDISPEYQKAEWG